MRIRGLIYASLGLLLGMSCGLGILRAKDYFRRELSAILNDEARIACGCAFEADYMDVSLLTLTAYAKNPRITKDGKPKLFFKNLDAQFSLAEIRHRTVLLSELILRNGVADGVDEDSVTYKFIDQLTTPIAPERDRPDRWKLKLMKIRVTDATAIHETPAGPLEGHGTSAIVTRTADDNFLVEGKVKSLDLKIDRGEKLPPSILAFGNVAASILLLDGKTDFRRVRLEQGRSWAEAQALSDTRNHSALNGAMRFGYDARDSVFAPVLQLLANGSGSVGGILSSPMIDANSQIQEPGLLSFGKDISIPIEQLESSFKGGLDDGYAYLDVNKFKGQNSNGRLALREPLALRGRLLGGALEISAQTIKIDDLLLENSDLTVSLGGTITAPRFNAAGMIGRLNVGGLVLDAVNAEADYKDHRINLNIKHGGLFGGDMNINGAINVNPVQEPSVEKLSVQLTRLPITGDLALSGDATLHGPLDVKKLTGSGTIKLQDRGAVRANGTIALASGLVTSTLNSVDGQILVNSTVSIDSGGRGEINLRADSLDLNTISSDISCGEVGVRATYEFFSNAFTQGDGKVDLNSIALGCNPFRVNLKAPRKLSIQHGELIIPGIQLVGPDGNVNVSGSVGFDQGYALSIDGLLQLRILLGLVSGVDDMSGSATSLLKVSGPISEPKITGELAVDNFGLAIEKSDIDVDNTSGSVKLSDDQIQFNNLRGRFNEGTFELSGSVSPLELAKSRVDLTLSGITFAPSYGVDGQISGQLHLAENPETKKGIISGKINIDNATVERKLDMRTIVQSLARTILLPTTRSDAKTFGRSPIPDLDLNISVSAPRDIIITSNLMGAELKANLLVEGTLNVPIVRGNIESISGWFRVKDRRVDITSGIVEFKPGSSEPTVSIIGEVYLSSLSGDSTLILVEVIGPLTQPRVNLTSDRGLSTSEILNLLSSTGSLSDQVLARANDRSMLSELQDPDNSLWDENFFSLLPRILSDLTRLNSVNIEPTYSLESGTIDPTVVAIKKITNRVELRGENRFGSTGNDSELAAYYRLTRSFSLVGKVQSLSTDRVTNVELNGVWYGFGRRKPFADISITGNNEIDTFELQELMRLHDGSRLRPDEVGALRERLIEIYRKRGFFNVSGDVICASADEFCRSLVITVDEGPESKISSYTTLQEGTSNHQSSRIAGDIVARVVSTLRAERPATYNSLQRVRKQVTTALRSEGFIAARVNTTYLDGNVDRQMQISFDPGNPVTFTFQGNTVFSAEDFLKTIDLFGRKQPFGSNTISILIENIERQYSSAGYLYATISYDRTLDVETGRVTFLIRIDEGNRPSVSEVRFLQRGTDSPFEISVDTLKDYVRKANPESVRGIFSPRYAVNEEIDQNAAILTSALVNQGYAQATVHPRIVGQDSAEEPEVNIEYQIDLNQQILIDKIEVNGIPSQLEFPEPPSGLITIPALNSYIEKLREYLIENGFFHPEVLTDMQIASDDSSELLLTINVRPGIQTYVGEISITGNSEIQTAVISKHLKLEAGSPWNSALIDESRREILRLGCFSQVEIGPMDGELDKPIEAMIVRVVERPLLSFDAGGGVNSEYGFHVFGEAIEHGLFSDGRNLALRVDGYYDPTRDEVTKGVASLQFSDPFVFDTNYNFTSDLRYQKVNLSTQEFDLNRVSLASYFHRSYDSHRSILIGHTILQDDLTDVNPGAIISDLDSGYVRLSYISGLITYDEQDDPVNPFSGHKISGNFKLSSDAFGSEANFIGIGGRTALRAPFFIRDRPFTLAFNTQLDSSWGFGDTDEIPITQRYYLGGRNNIRGYRENSLGPRGEDGAVIGGDLLFANNLELRYRYTTNLVLLTFVDSGTVFLKQRSVALDQMRESVGVGMRYLSPIGPIGFDIGHPLNQTNEPMVRVDFTIGSNF